MKNILNISLLSLVVVFLSSCYDDKTNDSFSRLYVSGPTGGAPLGGGNYSVGETPGTIAWSVDDATIASLSATSGSSVDVVYLKAGDFRITADNGSMKGWLDVSVGGPDAGVTVEYDAYGALRKDSTGTVTFTFDGPLSKDPLFGLVPVADTTLVDSVGTLVKVAADEYTVFMKGGVADGTPHAYLRDVAITDVFGGDVADTLEVELFRVDNTQPAMVDYTQEPSGAVNWGSDVSASIEYNEAVRPSMTDAADTAFWIYYTYNRDLSSKPGVVTDSMAMESEDGITWTVTLTVPDSISNLGGFSYVKTVGEFLDLAGNEVVNNISSPGSYTIDREGPSTPVTNVTEPSALPPGTDNQRWLNMTASSFDAGIGVDGYFYHIKEAYESDTTAAGVSIAGPKSLKDFSGEMSTGSEAMLMSTDSARYDIFWIAVDEFGFESDIDSARISYDKDGVFDYTK